MHTILLKSQYHNTPAAASVGPHWAVIREHKISNNCLPLRPDTC